MRESEILCTPEGDVLRQPGARSFFELIAAVAAPFTAERQRFWQESPRPAALAKVRELARIRPLAELPPFTSTAGDTLQRGPVRVEKLTLRNAEGTVLPALLFRPANTKTSTGFRLHLHEDGKQAEAGQGGPLEALARAGETVLAVDLRGLGELQRGKRPSGFKAPFELNWKSATVAYLLGQSLAGMRTEDILACARFASDQWNEGRPVHLTARGEAGIPALHAAALEPQLFASTRLERTLRTWTDVISTSRTRNQQANTVSGALRFYDLPDLVSTLPGNKLVLHEPVDAAGQVEKK